MSKGSRATGRRGLGDRCGGGVVVVVFASRSSPLADGWERWQQERPDASWEPVEVTLPWKDPNGPSRTSTLFFTSRESKPINRNHYNPYIWKPALVKAGIEPIRSNGMHALRHYYASATLSGGVSIRALADYLGHADPGFTLRIYAHLMPDDEDRARAILDAALGPRGSGAAQMRPKVVQDA